MAKHKNGLRSYLYMTVIIACVSAGPASSVFAQAVEQPRAAVRQGSDITRNERADIMSEIIMLRQLNSQLESYVPTLKQQNEQLNTRLKQLEGGGPGLTGSGAGSSDASAESAIRERDSMARELDRTKRYARELEISISKMKVSGAADVNSIIKERDSLKTEVQKLKDTTRVGTLAKEAEKTKRERDEAKKDLEHIKRYTRELESNIEKTKEQGAGDRAVSDEIEKMSRERDYYRGLAEKFRQEVDSAPKTDTESFDKVNKERDVLSEEVTSLRQYSRQLELRIARMKQAGATDSPISADLNKITEERDALSAEVGKLKKANEQISSYDSDTEQKFNQQLESALSSKNAVIADLEKVRSEKDAAVSELSKLRQSMRDIDGVVAEGDALRSRIEMQAQVIASTGKEREFLNFEIERLKKENQLLVKPDDLERVTREKEAALQENENLKRYGTALEATVARMKDTNAAIEQKNRDFDRVSQEADSLAKELDNVKKENQSMVKPEAYFQLGKERDALAQELNSMKGYSAVLEMNQTKLKEAYTKLGLIVKDQSVKLSGYSAVAKERDELRVELERMKKVNQDLEASLSTLQIINMKLEAKAKDLEKIESILLKK